MKNNKDIEAHPNPGESPYKKSTYQESKKKFSKVYPAEIDSNLIEKVNYAF